MNLDGYDLEIKSNSLSFEFYSEGPKGRIKKIIQFRRVVASGLHNEVYNLAFGDSNEEKVDIDDLVVSDNRDSVKVLSIVAKAVVSFTDTFPDAMVFAQGNTASRTRYYIMEIAKNLPEIARSFDIWGALGDSEWELFEKNKPYKELLVKRK